MKYSIKLLSSALLIIVGLNVGAQPKAEIVFEKIEHDYGKIKEDAGPADFSFNFKNPGTVPLAYC